MKLGRATVEGEWAGRVTGLGSQCVEIAMMVTPDGHSRLELSRFLTPPTISDHQTTPVNALGYLHVMFTGVKREAKEEACVDMEVGSVSFIYEYQPTKNNYIYGDIYI